MITMKTASHIRVATFVVGVGLWVVVYALFIDLQQQGYL